MSRRGGRRGIPLCAIRGTLEPSRAAQLDRDFRPAPIARPRWQRAWPAEERGATLPTVLQALSFEGDKITEITGFVDPSVFGRFGLPDRL